MKSAVPKVLHTICGVPLLQRVINVASELNAAETVVVLKHEAEQIQAALDLGKTALQPDVPGTGAGCLAGLEALSSGSSAVLVLSGDTPLIRAETLRELINFHQDQRNAISLLTAEISDPAGYGRIARQGENITGIVEEKDASPQEKLIREVNSGIYIFAAEVLREILPSVGRNNAQGEMYLTDVVKIAAEKGLKIGGVKATSSFEIEGVNTRAQLAALEKIQNRAIIEQHMLAGVTFSAPDSVWIEESVEIENDVLIEPNCFITGDAKIASGAQILLGSRIDSAQIASGALVGPYAFLRSGTELGAGAKVGAFVETKNANIGVGTKVPHLSYVGDAAIGANSNVGAGTIFANYDGVNKHHTTVGNNARIGSKTVLVAPVELGDNVYTGAASLILKDVPSGALALTHTTQITKPGWVEANR